MKTQALVALVLGVATTWGCLSPGAVSKTKETEEAGRGGESGDVDSGSSVRGGTAGKGGTSAKGGSSAACEPDCAGRECGSDGCDGTCGSACDSNQTCTSGGICMDRIVGETVSIPNGTFMMGSENGDPSERPVHSVTVAAFEMDATEVTVAAYQDCVDAGECSEAGTNRWCNAGDSELNNHPINCVDWNQAGTYCRWLGKRLPTEEEWEYAARGTDRREYPWGSGDPYDQLCWSGGPVELREATCAVGDFPGGDSPFGLHDMEGNVSEWTSSYWSEDYSDERTTDRRVPRGSNFFTNDAWHVRSTFRSPFDPAQPSYDMGFRCARSAP